MLSYIQERLSNDKNSQKRLISYILLKNYSAQPSSFHIIKNLLQSCDTKNDIDFKLEKIFRKERIIHTNLSYRPFQRGAER